MKIKLISGIIMTTLFSGSVFASSSSPLGSQSNEYEWKNPIAQDFEKELLAAEGNPEYVEPILIRFITEFEKNPKDHDLQWILYYALEGDYGVITRVDGAN